jgi:DNA helicase HerA-like ATPase
MADGESIVLGGGGEGHVQPQGLLLVQANRHGLIAGATGTGKTVTLQVLAEGFSRAGVPVFAADVKGDLAGLAVAGSEGHKLHAASQARAATIGLPLAYEATPVVFWDLFGEQGHPVRATVAEMGPLILARMLSLTDAQEGVLNVAFRVADEQGLALLDLKDLRAMLAWVGENAEALTLRYGNVAPASVGAIQRALLVLEEQGGDRLFGEPALDLMDLMRTDLSGRGVVNLLAADRLMRSPRLYASFLLWLLSELFERLPEVGNPPKPKLVFFFDEAHLLFDDAPKALVDKVEQVARLIRSKGVGVFFVTQNPADVPDEVLGQLGNRVQHALRTFTPKDQKALRQAAETFRPNPRFDIAEAIVAVQTGEAVTSLLDGNGVPGLSERTLVRPPSSRVGPLTPEERRQVMAASPVAGRYDTAVDRESAYEVLSARAAEAARPAEEEAPAGREFQRGRRWSGDDGPAREPSPRRRREEPTIGERLTQTVVKELTGTTGRRIVRGLLGGLFRGR